MKHKGRSRIVESFLFTFVLLVVLMGTTVLAQVRRMDQGVGGTSPWPSRICDTSGTNCVAVETTGTPGVYGLRTISVSVGGGGTVDQGTPGILAWLVKFDTVGVNNDVDVITATITQMPALTFTSGTVGGMPSLTFTSGTVNSIPAITQTSGTVNSSTISQIPSLTVTSGTIGQITMPSLTFTSGTVGSMPSLTITSGTVNSATITQFPDNEPFNLGQYGGVAVSTAQPLIDGGRASTDTRAAIADGTLVALRVDQWGNLIVVKAPQAMWATGNTALLTATTASAILAAPGAPYRWAITGWNACNLSGTVTTGVNLLDGTTIKDTIPWVQTATTAGESRCYNDGPWDPPFLMTANTAVNVQLTVSNATGVRVVVTGYKTGT